MRLSISHLLKSWPMATFTVLALLAFAANGPNLQADQSDVGFEGTVQRIEAVSGAESDQDWMVYFAVDRLLWGAFDGAVFPLRVHNPSSFKLKQGRKYRVEASHEGQVWVGVGFYPIAIAVPVPPGSQVDIVGGGSGQEPANVDISY